MKKSSFEFSVLKENEDGSADIQIEIGKDHREKVLEAGIYFLLLRGMYNASIEDIFRWVERGKTEENTDRIMKNLVFDDDTK
jgi:hypothetical protein